MNLIDTTTELENACKVLRTQKVIAIDSEFIREKTYYPIPCLLQIGYENGVFLLDPLAKDMDMSAFFDVLQDKNIMKVFHSGRQDIEILYNMSHEIPTPVFDTQIAAQVCGLGESVSYENLVRVYCNLELDKSCRLTNWQLRPLTKEQLEYAAGDVTHLLVCYNKMCTYLKEEKRQDWIAEDMADLVDMNHYAINPDDAWQRIRHNSHSVQFLNTLQALASWREKKAMEKNITRQNIIKDDMLLNIAVARPTDKEQLKQVRGMRSDIVKSIFADEMLAVINALNDTKPDKSLSKLDKEKEIALPPSSQSIYEILRLVLKIKCNEFGIVPHLVASERDLREYIKKPRNRGYKILNGWRYEVFGKFAEGFRRGELVLYYNPQLRRIEIKSLKK